jgi:hypothetical protein
MDIENVNGGSSADQFKEAAREIRVALAQTPVTLPPVEKPARENFAVEKLFDEANLKRADYLLSKPTSALTAEEQAELISGLSAWNKAGRP